MNVGMPQYGMPSGASSGAPYFNGWSPYGGFAQPQQGYGMSSPFGGFGGGYGMYSPFGGFGDGYGMPFQQMPMGGGKGGYSSPFNQFQTPNFAAKGGSGQPQLPASPATPNTQSPTPNFPSSNADRIPFSDTFQPQSPTPNIIGHPTGLPTNSGPPPIPSGGGPYFNPASPQGGAMAPPYTPPSPMQSPTPYNGPQGGAMAPPYAPITQAVPPQMMGAVSGPVQMLPQQTFNQTRIPGANSVLPGRNMLIGGYR